MICILGEGLDILYKRMERYFLNIVFQNCRSNIRKLRFWLLLPRYWQWDDILQIMQKRLMSCRRKLNVIFEK